ncbi:MAG: ExeA family protein [Thiotrichales bacterium]
MYETFYGFKEKPFALLPDPAFLYLSKRHAEALAMLEYGLAHRAGIILITGEIGCGKTTLIRHMLANHEQELVVGSITNTHKSFGELLKWVNLAFNLDYRAGDKVDLYKNLTDFLQAEYRLGKRVALVIDEAQNLSEDALEELRMLSNINVDKSQVLQLILVGQPELRDKLLKHELRQLTQRIAVDYFLEPLSPKEVFQYIRHRVRVAGADPDLFDTDAIAQIYKHSRGIPRIVNILSDTALVYGYAEERSQIDADTVNEVISDKKRVSILPIEQLRKQVDAKQSGVAHLDLGSKEANAL